jgi:hypothetical protein
MNNLNVNVNVNANANFKGFFIFNSFFFNLIFYSFLMFTLIEDLNYSNQIECCFSIFYCLYKTNFWFYFMSQRGIRRLHYLCYLNLNVPTNFFKIYFSSSILICSFIFRSICNLTIFMHSFSVFIFIDYFLIKQVIL